MKTQLKRLIQVEILAFLVVLACVFVVRAQADVLPVEEVPSWMKAVMDFIVGIPGVGPFLLSVLKWMGVVAAVLTGIATLIMGVANALKAVGTALGFQEFAAKVDAIYKKIWPWIAWLSMYNVQKP